MTVSNYTETVVADAANEATWFVEFQPRASSIWNLHHIAIRSTSYTGGSLAAQLLIGGTFWCGSSTGYNDAADGTPLLVYSYQILRVQWSSPNGDVIFNGAPTFSASILVDETS